MWHSQKLCIILLGIINILKAWVAIQKHLENLEKRTDRKLTKLNTDKCKVLKLERNKSTQ